MKLINLLPFFILLIFFQSAFAQSVQYYSGKVFNAHTKNPIEGASIIIKGKSKGVISDANGDFKLQAYQGIQLNISSIGFHNSIFIIRKDTIWLRIALDPLYDEQSAITITGSRGRPRTLIDRPVPVDVISSKELEKTGQIDLAQMAQFTSPSFISVKTGLNGASNYADPASLKGMSPDQSLVLINNKRRHQFAAISNTLVPGKGTVITDLNGIPALALERMEILRDGAAAQYGSDAIAGIINLILRRNSKGGTVRSEWGVTEKGDGMTFMTSINKGFSLGEKGSFLNITVAYQNTAATDRSDPFTATIYTANKTMDDSIRNSRGVWPAAEPAYVMKYGSNQTKALQSFVNFSYPLSKGWNWYGFGGSSNKEVTAYGFFRTAKGNDPNASALYPDGYTPLLPGKTADYSFVSGFEHYSESGWKTDISTGYGYNHLDLYSLKSSNPSLGLTSPTDFFVGRNSFGQSTTETNFNKTFKNTRFFKWINLAFGSQLRFDHYKLKEGDPYSYAIGPLAISENKATGSSGRPGISLSDRTEKWRNNIGSYLDLEADINEKLMLALAGRYEHYNDFGGNLSGKLAARWSIIDHISIRGSINRGFRAPSLQQIYNGQTTSNAQNGLIRQTKQLPADDPRLSALGIPFPEPELSWNYNVGLTAKGGKAFIFTLDGYQIDVQNRIIISEVLPVSVAIPSLLTVFPASTGIREITFFTNHINTRTIGIDLVASWKKEITDKQKMQLSYALTINKTSITNQKNPPALLLSGVTNPIKLIDTISQALITSAQPHQKHITTLEHTIGRLQNTLRITHFGEVTAWEKPTGSIHQSQTFSAKTLCDLSSSYQLSNKWQISLGVNNIFNIYPDRVNQTFASYTSGQVPFSRSALQFGFNGAFVFSSVQLRF